MKRANWASAETCQRFYKRGSVDQDMEVTNIVHSKLLSQRSEVPLKSNVDSIVNMNLVCLCELFEGLRDRSNSAILTAYNAYGSSGEGSATFVPRSHHPFKTTVQLWQRSLLIFPTHRAWLILKLLTFLPLTMLLLLAEG